MQKVYEEKWIIQFTVYQGTPYSYFICDGDYKYGGERYKVITETVENAKEYSSSARALSAVKKMLQGEYVNLSGDYKIIRKSELS